MLGLAAVTNLSVRNLLASAIWISLLAGYPSLAANASAVVVKAHLQRGHQLFKQKKYRQAYDEFSAASKLRPENPQILGYLGFTSNQRKEWKKSIDYFSKAIELQHSKVGTIYEGRGHAYVQLGKFEAALKDFDRAVELGRLPNPMAYDRGAALVFLNRFAEGLPYLDAALAQKSENRGYIQQLRSRAFYGLNRFAPAIEAATDSLKALPHSPDVLFTRGLCYYKTGKKQKAVDDLAEAIRLFRDSNRNDAAASAESALADVMR